MGQAVHFKEGIALPKKTKLCLDMDPMKNQTSLLVEIMVPIFLGQTQDLKPRIDGR